MVFTILDRIWGGIPAFSQLQMPWSIYSSLREEGFNHHEASNINWFIDQRQRFEFLGLFGGIVVAQSNTRHIKAWCLRNPTIGMKWLGVNQIKFLIVLASYGFLGAFGIMDHKGSNGYGSNLWNNDLMTLTRKKFIADFNVLNRRFTEEEVEQFLNQPNYLALGPRKYIYNPMIHENEEKYKEVYERLNSGKRKFSKDLTNKINEQNKQKTDMAEVILFNPFNINDAIDPTGYVLRRRVGYSFINYGDALE